MTTDVHRTATSPRLAGLFLFLIPALGLLFDTTHFGLLPLLLAVVLCLALASLWAARGWVGWLALQPVRSGFVLFAAALLLVLHRHSVSLDTSFVPSWVLWSALLFYALLHGAGPATRELTWRLVLGGIVGLMLFAGLQLVVTGARASWPVGDPNNFASVIYIGWIPYVHRTLARDWVRRLDGASGLTLPRTLAGIGLSGLAALALFATESRAGVLICATAIAFWWGLALLRRQPLRLLIVFSGAFALVFAAAVVLFGGDAVAPGGDNSLSGGADVRFGLVSAAWSFYLERPFFGSGLNTFALFYALRRPLWDQETAGRFVHNDYVQMLTEGGPLLLLLLLIVGLFAVFRLLRGMRAGIDSREFAAAGFALAACALLAHAAVNFVFYVLSLPLLLALLLAMSDPEGSAAGLRAVESKNEPPGGRSPRRAAMLLCVPVLLLGWVGAAYLALDVAVEGVLGGNTAVPLTANARSTPVKMRAFARRASDLNADRGLPLMADAALVAHGLTQGSVSTLAPRNGGPAFGPDYALARFRQALATDPWNTSTYMEMYGLLRKRPELVAGLGAEEQPQALLQRALALDGRYLPAIDELLRLSADQPELQARLLTTFVAPWLELIARQDLAAGQHYLPQLQGLIEPEHYAELESLLISLQKKRMDSRANIGWRPGPRA